MKKNISLCAAIAIVAMTLPFTAHSAPQVYDLKDDWSNTQNPNGTWSYLGPWLGFSSNQLMSDDPSPWADPESGAVLRQTTPADAVPGVLEPGDIYGSTSDWWPYGEGPVVRWTAPADGTINISGAVWATSDPWLLSLRWQLDLNPYTPSQVWISTGWCDSSSPSAPTDFSSVSHGQDALLNIPVQAGDELELAFSVDAPEPFGTEFTVTFTPDAVDPLTATENLALAVVDMNLQNGIANSLDSKLDAALGALDDAVENNNVAATNSLQAFINAVEAQRGNKLTEAQADQLIVAAQEIQDLLASP